jgi:glycosyltransferase involved in cell wall biosynthesis
VSPKGSGARIAIIRPDWRIVGGAELVNDRLEAKLIADGHDVERVVVDMLGLPHRIHGLDIPDHIWDAGSEYFRYVAAMEAFAELDLSRFDVAISTQPPSFAIDHPRHLCLFYHHLRIYYDLSELYVRAGFVDPARHAAAQGHIRTLDQPHLERVKWFVTNSENTARRLKAFNGLTNSSVLHAGPGVTDTRRSTPKRTSEHVLCVSRNEFPKRTELFVHALKHLPERKGTLVGTGGRVAFVRELDARLSAPGADLTGLRPEDLWLNRGEARGSVVASHPTNVEMLGHVDDAALLRLYSRAACIVAPAFDEDYGLTAVEAMRHGVPVVVAKDGGGLTDLIEDGVTGAVVEPEGAAIAEAVERFCADPALAARVGEAGRAAAERFTWERAYAELDEGLERVRS